MATILSREQLLQIAQEFGTPVYVYHAEKIKEQYQKLSTAFHHQPVRFFYACKALTNISILKYIKNLGCNIDCSSINEVRLALHVGFSPQQILYTSNGIAFDEIVEAKKLAVHINIDSLSNLEKFGQQFGNTYPVGIRLLPNIMAGGNLKIATGHDNSKFGIPVQQIDKIIALVKTHNLHIKHLHIHTGSDIKEVAVFLKGINVLFDIIPHFPDLQVIDLGGGFKVPYIPGEEETNIEALALAVEEIFATHPAASGKQFEIWFEPGKFLVSEAGYFITQVNVLKENKNIIFAAVNSGFNHLIRPMFYEAYHHITNISHVDGSPQNYTITGNICETDNFAWNRTIPLIREGDFLVFHNAGAYGFEMASNYNARFKPAEVLVKEEQYYIIRKADDLNDLLKNQLLID